MSYSLFLKKENFKFSSAHFTIFDASTSEALHGHNYRVGILLKSTKDTLENEMVCDFNKIKKLVKAICDSLDEKVLVPTKSRFLKIQKAEHFKNHTHVVYNSKNYVFPNDDVFMLTAENITSEALAHHISLELAPHLKGLFSRFTVSIEETRGQSASFSMSLR